MFFYGNPQFYGVRAMAANIGQSQGNYTAEMFQEDFPQFFSSNWTCYVPETMLNELISMANACVQPDKWLESWRYAAGLYVAHYATLYLRTYANTSPSASQAAASGAMVGVVKSATLGDSSVSYDTSAVTKGTEDWGDLNATTYGQMLANRAKLVGLGGSYVL